MAKYLTRAQILSRQGFRTTEVDASELGGTLLVRELTASEMNRIGFGIAKRGEGEKTFTLDITSLGELAPDIVSWCVVNEKNEPVLTRGDVDRLSAQYWPLLQRVLVAVIRLSKLTPDEEEEEGEGEAGEKKAATDGKE